MRYFAVVVWQGDVALLDPPAIVCRVWHPTEGPDFGLELDPDELETEIEQHERGYWYCECFSRVAPEGGFGYRSERWLYPISQADFERAVELLRERDLPEYLDLLFGGHFPAR